MIKLQWVRFHVEYLVAVEDRDLTEQGPFLCCKVPGSNEKHGCHALFATPASLHGRVSKTQVWVHEETLKKSEVPLSTLPATALFRSVQSPRQTASCARNSAMQCLGVSQFHPLQGTGARLPSGDTSTRTGSCMRIMLCACNVPTPVTGPVQASKRPSSPPCSPGLLLMQ